MISCDYCGKKVQPIFWIGDKDNIWNKEYNRRVKKKIKNLKGIKRLLIGWFSIPNMPFYSRGSFDFCSDKCYEEWKKLAKKKFANPCQGEGGKD